MAYREIFSKDSLNKESKYSLLTQSLYDFCKAHGSTLVILLLSIVVFLELVRVVSVPMSTQFWGDEYVSLDVALLPNFFEIGRRMLIDGNGPIFGILLWFWYRIVPYGDKYLLLLPQIFVALSVLMTGIASRKLLGNKGGIFAAVLMLININYIRYGNELRTYSLTVFASALMLWLYFRRLEIMGKENTRSIAVYGVSVALLAYTHYCTFFVYLLFFLYDIVLIIKNKVQRRVIFSYIVAAVIFLPWFIYYLKNVRTSSWQFYIPSMADMFTMIEYLNSRNQVLTLICVIAIIFSVIMFLRRNMFSTRLRAMFVCSVVAVGFIIIMYASSVVLTKYLHKGNFWVDRYFLVIIPFLVFVISALFTEIFERIRLNRTIAPILIISIVLIFYLPRQYMQLNSVRSPTQWGDWLESAANWLYEQSDIYGYETGVYCTIHLVSWRVYSLEQLGRRPKLHYVYIDEKILSDINKLYTVEDHIGLSQEQLSKIKEDFELIEDNQDIRVKTWRRKKGQ